MEADIALRSAAAVGDIDAIHAAMNEGACLDSTGLAIVNARATGIQMAQDSTTPEPRYVLTPRQEDRRAGNALQFALTCGNAPAARELLRLGADPRLGLDSAPPTRSSPVFSSAFSTPRVGLGIHAVGLNELASPTHAPVLLAGRSGSRGGLRAPPKRAIGSVATPLKPRPPLDDAVARRASTPAGLSPLSAIHSVERGWESEVNGKDSNVQHSTNPHDSVWMGTAVHIANVNRCCTDVVWEAVQAREGPAVPPTGAVSGIRRLQGLAPLRRVPLSSATVAPIRRSSEPIRGVAPQGTTTAFTRGRFTPHQIALPSTVDSSLDDSVELEALALPSAAMVREPIVLPGRRSTTATPPRGVTPIRTPTPERNMECMRQLSEVRGEVEAFLASHQFYSGTPTTVDPATGRDVLDWDGDLHKRVHPPQFAVTGSPMTKDSAAAKKAGVWDEVSQPSQGKNLLAAPKYLHDAEDDFMDDASGSDSDTDAPPCFPRTPLSYLSQFSNMASPSSALQMLGSLGQIRFEKAAEMA